MYSTALLRQARTGGERYIPINVYRGHRVCIQIILSFSFVVVGVAASSGQDLGALAREEKARKQAQPVHQSHVYTNDDLVRPQILMPNDDAEFRTARKHWSPTTEEVQPELVIESDPLELPLGNIARQYREQKAARQLQSRMEGQSVHSSHVYTNDDLVRPQILTPEDHAALEYARKNWSPATQESLPQIVSEEMIFADAPSSGSVSVSTQAKTAPGRTDTSPFRLLLGSASLASPGFPKRPALKPARVQSVSSPREKRTGDHVATKQEDRALLVITVRRGDSLWKLARQYLGQGNRWHDLWEASPWIQDPNHLKVGTQIRI